MKPIIISDALMQSVYAEARNSYPAECCGWLTGGRSGSYVDRIRRCDNDQSSGNHPTQPERGVETAYVFSSSDVMELNQSLETDHPALIIYHSHPNGQAYLSDTDREVATSPWGDGPAYPVQQLVVGIDDSRVVESALFAWSDSENSFVEIARYPGAEL